MRLANMILPIAMMAAPALGQETADARPSQDRCSECEQLRTANRALIDIKAEIAILRVAVDPANQRRAALEIEVPMNAEPGAADGLYHIPRFDEHQANATATAYCRSIGYPEGLAIKSRRTTIGFYLTHWICHDGPLPPLP